MTRSVSLPDRVGLRNETSGTTEGKSNHAAYVAFPDKRNTTSVSVLGYEQLHFISPHPKCCKATLTLHEFQAAFMGGFLFTKIDKKIDAS